MTGFGLVLLARRVAFVGYDVFAHLAGATAALVVRPLRVGSLLPAERGPQPRPDPRKHGLPASGSAPDWVRGHRHPDSGFVREKTTEERGFRGQSRYPPFGRAAVGRWAGLLATGGAAGRWDLMHRSASVILVAWALVAVGCAGTAPLQPKAVQLNRAGTEALASGDLETAEARFALALEYHPRFIEALVNLGLVEMQRGNFERARLEFERARRINADLAQPHHALGVLAERERRPDVAAEHYREALRVNPGFAPSRGNLARMLFAAGRYDDAREQFLRLVEVAPTELAGRTGLAETLLQLDRAEESDAVVDRALRDFGPVPSLVILAARRLLRREDSGSAEALLLPLTRAGDDNARTAWSWIAMGRLARRDDTGAFEACEKAFALDRNDALATYVVAMGLRGNRDRRALPWLERAHLLSPHNAVLFDELRKARAERM